MSGGYCKSCGGGNPDSDLCDGCSARMDAEEDRPRRRFVPADTGIRVPYDPEEPF